MSLRSSSLLALLLAATLCVVAAPGRAQPAPLTPEQREERWKQLTPDQRQQLWRSLTPEQKGEVIRNLTPEQRARIQERIEERRAERMGEGRRLTPEERQKLRDQINEANRDLRNRPMHERPGPGPGKR
jgi:Spy/CpxP family protein refolding chaperone